ncbi:MAG: hypothetical protein E6205_08250 [Winkia neuii]|uniref:hypothetical protein n=1 Tax=Winkia neuii TaxID=33007 RepID=UPI00290B204E|nr:hypothetical protein [Winkia neuii]MDU5162506.1 hypothetical protein [Winkia neuii]
MQQNLDKWLIRLGIVILIGWILTDMFGTYVSSHMTAYSNPLDYFVQGLWNCAIMFFTSYNGIAILMAGLIIREVRASRADFRARPGTDVQSEPEGSSTQQ